MRIINRHRWLLLLTIAAACAGSQKDQSRDRVASALRDTLGKTADPQVAFVRDSTHLLVQLSGDALPTASDSVTEETRRIGNFALRHYERANELDSVTILYHRPVRPGVWRILQTRAFPVESLRR
jgi:hypothetical protein